MKETQIETKCLQVGSWKSERFVDKGKEKYQRQGRKIIRAYLQNFGEFVEIVELGVQIGALGG